MEFEQLGPYRIQGILGRGGMGSVYKGVHVKNNETVAVKVIASSLSDQERFRRRFAAEVETLKRLKHPNIVQLIGYGEEKGHLFYSMEFVAGESLQSLLGRTGTLDWKRVIDIGIEICSGLKQAHDFGVIHRDLKPANIMLTETGQVKLTDFGIAKLFGGQDSTVAGAVIGTADFMPPEQAEGKPVTVRSDLYALGSLCYAAISGRAPFVGSNLPEVLYAVRYSPHIPLRKLVPGVPMEVAELIDELLAKKPGERPPTALVVGNRLQALRVGLKNVEVGSPTAPIEKSIADRASRINELTSIDLEELNSASLLSDARQTVNEGSFEVRHDVQNRERSQVTQRKNVAGPEEVTRVATPSQIAADPGKIDAVTANPIGQTRFTVVEDDDRQRSLEPIPELSTTNNWIHYGSIAALVGLLLVCIGALWSLTRPPTANQLYESIISAAESGDENKLLNTEQAVDQFRGLYPNDPRKSEIDLLYRDIDVLRRIRRVMRQAKTGGGTQELQPIEQAFLDCVELRSVNALAAENKLQSFLSVFAANETLSDSQKKLVDSAKYMLDRIRSRPDESVNPAAGQLDEMIRWGKSNLPRDLQSKYFQGIIDLYENKAWASKSVADARRVLESMKDKP